MDRIELISEILYVETTFVGIAGAFLCHAIFWFIVFQYDQPYGVAAKIRDFLRTTKRYNTTIFENMKGEIDMIKMYGIEDEPSLLYVPNIMTCFHHSTGGALILAGILTNRPFLVRHGMMTEAGGMDLLHFLKLASMMFFKPGPWPERRYNTVTMVLWSCHHSVALSAVVPIIFYFSEEPQFQQLAFVLLGAPFIMLLPALFVDAYYGPEYKWIHAFVKVLWGVGFLHQRAVYFFPAAYSILKVVSSSEIPPWSKYALYYSCFAMTMFNALVVPLYVVGAVMAVKTALAVPGSDAEIEGRRLSRASVRASHSIASMGTFISGEVERRQNVTTFCVTSKLIAKAAHAKHVMEEERNKKKK